MKTIRNVLSAIKKKSICCKNKILLVKLLGYKFSSYPVFLADGVMHIKQLKSIKDFSLTFSDNKWICRVNGLNFIINSAEELLILEEIFINGTYNVTIEQPFTFVDVGMNVGITSLFFATKPSCKRVIAFEPFKPTLLLAKKNFACNQISQKIEIREVGMGYPPRIIKVNYSEKYKGSMGINGIAPYLSDTKDRKEEELTIVDTYELLKEINDEIIVLKIDCEGAEYEILERLKNTHLLAKFTVIMIEWHLKGASLLKNILIENNFNVLSFNDYHLTTGMIYAFKNKS